MITLTLHQDEADAVERMLNKILTNKTASDVLFESGSERRSVKRVSMKLHWAKESKDETKAA